MLLESQISSQPLAKRLILNFFLQSFLSRDAYVLALGRDVINGRSKLTSQRPFASVRGRGQCIGSVIASSTVGALAFSFEKICQGSLKLEKGQCFSLVTKKPVCKHFVVILILGT